MRNVFEIRKVFRKKAFMHLWAVKSFRSRSRKIWMCWLNPPKPKCLRTRSCFMKAKEEIEDQEAIKRRKNEKIHDD